MPGVREKDDRPFRDRQRTLCGGNREQRRLPPSIFRKRRDPRPWDRTCLDRRQGGARKGHSHANRPFLEDRAPSNCAREGKKADLLLGNNVLAHVPDLNGFVEGLRVLLAPRGPDHHGVPPPLEVDGRNTIRHDLPRALLLLFLSHRRKALLKPPTHSFLMWRNLKPMGVR